MIKYIKIFYFLKIRIGMIYTGILENRCWVNEIRLPKKGTKIFSRIDDLYKHERDPSIVVVWACVCVCVCYTYMISQISQANVVLFSLHIDDFLEFN